MSPQDALAIFAAGLAAGTVNVVVGSGSLITFPTLLALGDPDVGPELHELLGRPLDQPERDKARAIVSSSPAIVRSIAVGRGYADQAAEAATACPSRELSEGLARLAHSLLDGLPAD